MNYTFSFLNKTPNIGKGKFCVDLPRRGAEMARTAANSIFSEINHRQSEPSPILPARCPPAASLLPSERVGTTPRPQPVRRTQSKRRPRTGSGSTGRVGRPPGQLTRGRAPPRITLTNTPPLTFVPGHSAHKHAIHHADGAPELESNSAGPQVTTRNRRTGRRCP